MAQITQDKVMATAATPKFNRWQNNRSWDYFPQVLKHQECWIKGILLHTATGNLHAAPTIQCCCLCDMILYFNQKMFTEHYIYSMFKEEELHE